MAKAGRGVVELDWREEAKELAAMSSSAKKRLEQRWSLGPGGAVFSPKHSVARGPARKPVPHTQRKLPGVFSQRPGAQGVGTRRHSSTSEGTEPASYMLARERTLQLSPDSTESHCPTHQYSECPGGRAGNLGRRHRCSRLAEKRSVQDHKPGDFAGTC